MAALREIFAYFGIKFDDKQLEKGDKQVTETTKDLKKLEAEAKKTEEQLGRMTEFVAGLFAVDQIRGFIQGFVDATRETNTWASSLRMSTQEMLGWQYVASRFGVSTDDLTSSLKDLQVRAQDAVANGGSYAEAFRAIGVSTADLRPIVNDASALMELFADRMNSTTDQARQLFAVDELLGDAGIRMIPILRRGSDQIRRWRGEAARTAGRDAPAMTRAMQTLGERSAELNLKWQALRNQIIVALVPAVESFSQKLEPVFRIVERGVPWLIELAQTSSIVQTALVGAGLAVALAWGPAALAAVWAIAPWVAFAAVAEDLITTIRGGDSVTRRFLKSFLGAERTAQLIRDIRDGFEGMAVAIGKAEAAVRGFFGARNTARDLRDPLQRREAEQGYASGFSARVSWNDWWNRQQIVRNPTITSSRASSSTTVNAPASVNITVNEASDAETTAQLIREGVSDELGNMLRNVQLTLGGTP